MIRHNGKNKDNENENVSSIMSNMEIEKSLKNQQKELVASMSKVVLEQIKNQIGNLHLNNSGQQEIEDFSEDALKNIAKAMIKNNKIDDGNIKNIGVKHKVKTDSKKIKNTLDILKSLE